ncbi:MAG: Ig-like domain-containing protein [Aeromicrobium sp.]
MAATTRRRTEGQVSIAATVTITVTPTDSEFEAVNDSSTVVQDSGTTTLTPSPLANDSTGGGTVGGSVTSQPSHGAAAIGADGEFTYAPDPGSTARTRSRTGSPTNFSSTATRRR